MIQSDQETPNSMHAFQMHERDGKSTVIRYHSKYQYTCRYMYICTCTVDWEIFAVKKFSLFAQAAKFRRAKIFIWLIFRDTKFCSITNN